MVAIHAAGAERVLLARRSAAQLWDMRRRQHHTIELLVPWRQHDAELAALRLQLDGQDWALRVKVRRTRTLWESHATSMDNLPITTPARTIIDLASVLPIDELRSVLIDARQRRIVTLAEVIDLHEFLRRYPGRAKLGRVLRDLDDADSRLEWEFRREAERRGFRPHPGHFAFRCSDGVCIEIDVAFPDAWVAVEIDGYGSHSERESLVIDHKRQNRAVLDGWRPFRVDWTRFKFDTDAMFDELALLLKTPHSQPGPPELARVTAGRGARATDT